MLTINWKKGQDKLVVDEEDGAISRITALKSGVSSKSKSKRDGHYKF
jgi:hypothetical protein